ncbi:RDD family protein [Streptomyces sp. NPDC007084]|uniref:RDD family protein n=1 Tax=Streptomyces sp. NPDC007084 TaxID=3154313 RepID=UPI0034558FFF
MSAPTPAPGDDRPREGYYPDPSIPGYVRYWNGAAWVPGTSRPAPSAGEPLVAPAGVRPAQVPGPAPAPAEETGPHFFDEDPEPRTATPAEAQHGSRPEPAAAWGADRSRQTGFGGEPDRRVSWGAPQVADPRVPRSAGPADPASRSDGVVHADGTTTIPPAEPAPGAQAPASGGPVVFRRPADPVRPADAEHPGAAAGTAPSGTSATRGSDGTSGPGGTSRPAAAGSGAADGRALPGAGRPGASTGTQDPPPSEGTMAMRALSPRAERPGAAHGEGTGRAGTNAGSTDQRSTDQSSTDRGSAGRGSAGQGRTAPAPGAASAASAPTPSPAPSASPAAGSGFGAGQAAQAAAAQASAPAPASARPPAPAAHSAPAPAVPQQSGPATPMASGSGGGQPSWAQQVHRLAGDPAEQGGPVAPWKPPVEDVFQAAARRQAAARPAGLGRRLVARLFDNVILAAVTGVAAVPLGTRAIDHIEQKIDAAKLSGEKVTVWLLDGTTSVCFGGILAVLLLFGVLYDALPTAKWGRTLGKKLCGVEVRDIEAHEPPAFGRALARWLVFSVPGLLGIGVLGILWGLFDRPWHQCWHDKAAHTFVAGPS